MHFLGMALAGTVSLQGTTTEPSSDLMKDVALVVLGAVLGFASTLVSQRVLDRKKELTQRRDALRAIDSITSSVVEAVGHGHDFKNKADWSKELDRLTSEDRQWLGELYEPAKRIAWRIRDQSFDHDNPDAAEYCCDELLADLSLLQLKLLPLVPMKRNQREQRARELARAFLRNLHGVLPPDHERYINAFLKDWADGRVSVHPKYVMSSVLRSTSQARLT